MIDSSPWANRPHRGRPTVPLKLTPEQRMDIEAAIRPEKAERRIVVRGQALLFMADGVPASDIAMVLGVHERTVFKWRQRFECDHPETKLADAPRPGRPPSLSRPPTARRS
ncbi:MAG: helix-turn-helix domain-containing protein [Minicystis sp.]